MFRLLALIMILAMEMPIFGSLAYASPNAELSQTQKEIKAANVKTAYLETELRKLKNKEKSLKEQMIKTAAALQESEAELSALEEKMRILNEQITQKTDDLKRKKKNMAVMVQASIKLGQTPPEAIILMPGDMMNNMKASRALKMTTDSIKEEAESIKNQMAELTQLKEQVVASQVEAKARKEKLDEQRKILKTQIAEHNALQQKLYSQQKEAKQKSQMLAKKASDLQGLIAALEKEKEQEKQREIERKQAEKIAQQAKEQQAKEDGEEEVQIADNKPSGDSGKLRSFKVAKGNIRVPVAGKLVQRYGVEGRNETSKGITISARPNAQVIAPYDAEVMFTGAFMAYGRMIILRHRDGYHTLLAGIAKIDVSVGDFLTEGEPIGVMGEKEPNNRLYMELRDDNQPINPAGWVRGLK